jgi:hypothetical protein
VKLQVGRINLGIRGLYIVIEIFGLWFDLSIYRGER